MIKLEKLSLKAGDFSIENVDLQISEGEYFVLLGPNGSGKTLLVSAICGLIRVKSGKIFINGRDVTNIEPRHRRIGFVPQDYGLFPHLTVAENVIFTLRARGTGRKEALNFVETIVKSLNLEKLMKRYPYNLSGGEKQKVAMARAVAGSPELLILDEPLSSLDPATYTELSSKLLEMSQKFKLTTIHICHNMREASALSDRVGIMLGGKLVQAGGLEEILKHTEIPGLVKFVHER